MMAMRFVALSLLACVLLIGGIGWDSTPNKTEVGHMAANCSWRTLRLDVFAVNPPTGPDDRRGSGRALAPSIHRGEFRP